MTDDDPSSWSIGAGRLRYDHGSFERRFAELRERVSAAGWVPLAGAWNGLSADVVRHMAFEELSVFPGFARHKPRHGDLIRRLLDEHENLRKLLDVLSSAIAADETDVHILDGFAASMRSHEAVESLRLYPWLEMQDRGRR